MTLDLSNPVLEADESLCKAEHEGRQAARALAEFDATLAERARMLALEFRRLRFEAAQRGE